MTPSVPQNELSTEEELVLRLARRREWRNADLERITQLSAHHVDHDRLTRVMAAQRMFTLLGSRLIDLAGPSVPDDFRRNVEASFAEAMRRGTAVEALTLWLTDSLEGAGIPCLPLKGQTLSRAVHGQPGLRAAFDIDLLVDIGHLSRASEVIQRLGYVAVDERRMADGLPLLHLSLVHPGAALPQVDLHWRIHWYERRFSAEVVRRSRPDPTAVRRAVAEDELASLLLFFARDGFVGLRLAADLAAWWDVLGDTLGPNGLDDLVRAHPDLAPALRAATIVADLVVGVPRARILSDLRPRGRRESMASSMVNWAGRGDSDQVAANVSLVDAMLTPSGSAAAFVRRQLVTSGALGTASHAGKTLARFGAALWRVRGGSRWAPLVDRPS